MINHERHESHEMENLVGDCFDRKAWSRNDNKEEPLLNHSPLATLGGEKTATVLSRDLARTARGGALKAKRY